MPDREKVIKGLEHCSKGPIGCQTNCPYQQDFGCRAQLTADALFLLEEQEIKTGHWIVLEDCANSGIYCSECQCKIFDYTTKPKKKFSMYCPHCGSRNEQFFRDGEVVFR